MRTCKHRNIRPGIRQRTELVFEQAQKRKINFLYAFFQGKRNSSVVDVLGSKAEMDKLFKLAELKFIKLFFDKVLDRLYIMVGGFFYFLDFFCIRRRKFQIDLLEILKFFFWKFSKFRQWRSEEHTS